MSKTDKLSNKSNNVKEMIALACDNIPTQYFDGESWKDNYDYPEGAINRIILMPHVSWRKTP